MNAVINVSVITPLYKHKYEYVKECLESLRTQELPNIEFILIDNGANLENKNLIAEYCEKDNRFVSYKFKKNQGLGKALNFAILRAKGQYIGFLESDDYAAPSFYKELFENSQNGKVEVVKSLYYSLSENNVKKLECYFPKKQLNTTLYRNECSGMIQAHVSHWSGIYLKSFLIENNLFFNETPGGHSQDFGFILKCFALANSVFIVPKAFVVYRTFSGVHNIKYLNDCMLDECELTINYLIKKKLSLHAWDIILGRIGPRLLECRKTSSESQIKRLKLLLTKVINIQDFSLLPNFVKDELINFVGVDVSNRKKFISDDKKFREEPKFFTLFKKILKIVSTDGYFKVKFLGLDLISKINTRSEHSLRFCYFPLYYKKVDLSIEYFENLKRDVNSLFLILKKQNNELVTRTEDLKKIIQDKAFEMDTKIANSYSRLIASFVHPDTFGIYKNAFYGKDVVLVCSGPSASRYRMLKDAIHVGVNGAIYQKDVSLDFVFVQDYTIKQQKNSSLVDDVIKYKGNNCKKFFGIIPDKRLEAVKNDILRIPLSKCMHSDISQYILEDQVFNDIAYDLSYNPMGDFSSTTFSALQFILYTNPKRIFLVGWDCNLGYFYNRPNSLNGANYQIEILKRYFLPYIKNNYPDLQIISVNPIGLKGIFQDIIME